MKTMKKIKLLAVALAGAGCLACASSRAGQQVEQQVEQLPELGTIDEEGLPNAYCPQPRDVSACRPVGAMSISACKVYEENSDWLPPGYAFKSNCICRYVQRRDLTMLEWLAADDPTAACARTKIVAQLTAAPEQLREQGRLCNSKEGAERDACFETYLTPAIARMHQAAYTKCCCPCGPAPDVRWISNTSESTSCPSVRELFELFGSCHGTPGRW